MAIVLRKPTATACPASHEVMVRYVESCDRGPMRAVAVRLGRADACKIPIAVIVSYDGDERLNDGDHVRS